MKLPRAEEAVVPREKVTDYLLSSSHRTGRAKAEFFTRFGFTVEGWWALADALKRHAASCEVEAVQKTAYGTRYTIEGPLETPDGRNPRVRTVWFVEAGGLASRLVTAYPCSRKGRRP